jgi:PAS domain S-box-containing protein
MTGYRLSDLVDLTKLQKMADAYHGLTGMPIGILDAVDGSVIAESGGQDIFVEFRRATPVLLQRRQQSDDSIKVPIVVAGRHLATLLLGQFFYEGEVPDREQSIQLAHENGFDVDEYLAALDRVPVFSREKVDSILEYDKTLVSFLVDLAEQALLKGQEDKTTGEGERKFHAVFDHTYEFIGLLSIDGKLLEANAAFLRFSGAEKAEIIGRLFWEPPLWAHSSELQEQICLAVQKAANGEFVRFEASHISADGDVRNVDFTLNRVTDGADKVVFLIAEGRDITEHKRAEMAVRRSEEKLRSFVERSPFGIFRRSIEEDKFLDVNPAFVEMLGYASAEELCSNRLCADAYLSANACEQILTPLLRDGSFNGIEIQSRRKNGEIIITRLSGRLVQESLSGELVLEGIVDNITERKLAEQALRHSEEYFRQVVEGAPVGIFIQTQGILRYFNPAALAMYGAENASQIVGNGYLEIIHPDSRAAVIERARLVNEEKQSVPFLEERLLRLDGTVFDGEVTAIPFIFEERAGALVFVRDITEVKREERSRHELEQQLRQAQKMEAVGRLAGGVAHDFNNLLMVIQSYTELLQESLPPDHALQRNTQAIKKATRRAASLTNQMLAFSRKQIIAPVVLDLNSVIEETTRMLMRVLGEDIEILVELEEPLWAIEADSDQIVQILMNLCVNARDAMPQGGTLTITTENVTVVKGSIPAHPYIASGKYVKVSVADTGAGISKQAQEQIFEPFFTTKEVGKGTGLGLAMVYGIVKQNGGYVWVESEPGQGACFTIYLPKATGVIASDTLAKAEAPPRGTETLLIAEDEEALREAMSEFLRSLGYTVLAAGSGSQALSLMSEHPGHIDLLLTDVVMPKMSGRELSNTLGSQCPELKTIFMSGYTEDAVLRHGIHAMGTTFLRKPFSLSALAWTVRNTLGPAKTGQ